MIALFAALVILCAVLNSAAEGKLLIYWLAEVALLALLVTAAVGMK